MRIPKLVRKAGASSGRHAEDMKRWLCELAQNDESREELEFASLSSLYNKIEKWLSADGNGAKRPSGTVFLRKVRTKRPAGTLLSRRVVAIDPFAEEDTESDEDSPSAPNPERVLRERSATLLEELGPTGLPRTLALLERAGAYDASLKCRMAIQPLKRELAVLAGKPAPVVVRLVFTTSSMALAPHRGPLS